MGRQNLGALEKLYVSRMTKYLAEKGKEIVEAAVLKDVGYETLNQVDSYGIIIYYNGRVKKSIIGGELVGKRTGGFTNRPDIYNVSSEMASKGKRFKDKESGGRHKGWKSKGIPDGTGYEWARMFIKEFGKSGNVPAKGFALVVFNAAFYSKILEEGKEPLKRKYRVLSIASTKLQDIQREISGSTLKWYNL